MISCRVAVSISLAKCKLETGRGQGLADTDFSLHQRGAEQSCSHVDLAPALTVTHRVERRNEEFIIENKESLSRLSQPESYYSFTRTISLIIDLLTLSITLFS